MFVNPLPSLKIEEVQTGSPFHQPFPTLNPPKPRLTPNQSTNVTYPHSPFSLSSPSERASCTTRPMFVARFSKRSWSSGDWIRTKWSRVAG
ncbi:hypothetical protein E2C01_077581 [Portunus trituberculatus]|uniref:Uncharacterized protein n=1 Tax=Portunus trituberculatus TaxID=210409 RepID=A0A5B7IRP1_PORTR|nr:hypothetical protein [Portunus trituberculatus]